MRQPKKGIQFAAHFIKHAVLVSWRLNRGNLYIFRDQPQWFVVIVAMVARMRRSLQTDSPYAFALGDRAREELRVRYKSHMMKKYPLWPDTTPRQDIYNDIGKDRIVA